MKREKRNEYLERMRDSAINGDYECAHSDADDILCEMLIELGYQDIIDLYNQVGKWYA